MVRWKIHDSDHNGYNYKQHKITFLKHSHRMSHITNVYLGEILPQEHMLLNTNLKNVTYGLIETTLKYQRLGCFKHKFL